MVYRVSCAWIGPMDEVELTNMAITIANVLQIRNVKQIRQCPTNLPMFYKSANVFQICQCFPNLPMFYKYANVFQSANVLQYANV